MKIYDCFIFYNEFELLELRLKALWDVVDYFVIVEADKKHTNEPKPFYFGERQDDFREFFSKIRHVPVEMNVPFKGVGDWSIENAQRNAIMYGLGDAQPDDLIMISDLDEIPAPHVLQHLHEIPLTAPAVLPMTIANKGVFFPAQLLIPASNFLEFGPIVVAQEFFYYYFDNVAKGFWRGTVISKRKNLTMPQEFRNTRNSLPYAVGGYHFSYMGGVDRVINKMTSIVDGNELVVRSGGKLIDRKHVEEVMAQGKDIYARKGPRMESQFYPYDAHNIKLPHIDEFLRKYPHFLREPKKYFKENF